MSIENDIARIAAALEKLANVTDETPAPKPAKKASTKPKAEPKSSDTESSEAIPKVTEVRKALGEVQKAYDADKARELLREVGEATVMSKLSESKYAALISAAAKLVAEKTDG